MSKLKVPWQFNHTLFAVYLFVIHAVHFKVSPGGVAIYDCTRNRCKNGVSGCYNSILIVDNYLRFNDFKTELQNRFMLALPSMW